MGRVLIDVSVMSASWFKTDALPELERRNDIVFVVGDDVKNTTEVSRVRDLLAFLKLMGDKGRVERIPKKDIDQQANYIIGQDSWRRCTACDDEHIFALVYIKHIPFIFSTDRRLATCRNTMRRFVDRHYCSFSVISNKKSFDDNRHQY